MAYVGYHNFMDIEKTILKITDEEHKNMKDVVNHFKLVDEYRGGLTRSDLNSYNVQMNEFKKDINDTMKACIQAYVQTQKTSGAILPSLPPNENKKMIEKIKQIKEAYIYNLNIYKEILKEIECIIF